MEFTCAACGGTFEKGWSDEEQEAEAQREFPGLPPEERAVVCDDCYGPILAANDHQRRD